MITQPIGIHPVLLDTSYLPAKHVSGVVVAPNVVATSLGL
jgi:hypothetical protein